MPTNRLRSQAAYFLTRALEAQERGQTVQAHELTMKAAEFLEDAMSIEQLRVATRRVATRPLATLASRSARSQSQ